MLAVSAGVVVVVVVGTCFAVDENSFCSVTFSSLSSSASSFTGVDLPNLKVALFLLEKSSLGLIDGLSSPRMGKLGKFLPGDKSIRAGSVFSVSVGAGAAVVVISSSDPITILLETVELMNNRLSGLRIF